MDFSSPASRTQLRNIEAAVGIPLDVLKAEISTLGGKHSERRILLMDTYGLSHVNADTLLLWAAHDGDADPGAAVDALYAGKRAPLRPLHDAVVALLDGFGAYGIAPKKGTLSFRRRRQFAMITPMARQIAIGINARDLAADGLLRALPPGRLCQYEVRLEAPDDLDPRVSGWLRAAYDAAA